MTHALNCKTGGFITIRHNRVRDFEAQSLTKICNDVEIKPPQQPLEGEIIKGPTGVNRNLMHVLEDFGEKDKTPLQM